MSAPIINIFTYGLPYKLANQIYKEFQDRLKDVHFCLVLNKRYRLIRTRQFIKNHFFPLLFDLLHSEAVELQVLPY
jgi:hypothetical protein